MVLYVYTSIYTFTKKKKNILIYIMYYIIKDMETFATYIFVKCIILKIFYYRMDRFSLKEGKKK